MPATITTGSITERGMLVCLTVHKWTARKHDREVTDKVTQEHGADRDSGHFNKSLVPKGVMKPIDTISSRLRAHHYENTLPWSDQGYRILPAKNYFHYIQGHNALRDEFDAAVRDFKAQYVECVAAAQRSLGGLFRRKDYPTLAEIGDKFDIDLSVMALPTGADFRVELDDELRTRLAREIEERTHAALAAATRDIWQRLYDGVEDLRDRLKRYQVDANGKVEQTFRDSAVLNLQELVRLLPRLNMMGDADLDAMARRLETTLCAEDPEQLRRDQRRREAATHEADAILAAMAGYVGAE
jgi:hypothetical protein